VSGGACLAPMTAYESISIFIGILALLMSFGSLIVALLADVFNRLGYMERKGSGFGKIISGYEFQINYSEGKRPTFRSDRYQFTVVMPNLNYSVPQDVPQDKLDVKILNLIRKDNKISTEKMAIALGVSSKTIKRHIKEMDNVCYVGRGFSGYWEITDKE